VVPFLPALAAGFVSWDDEAMLLAQTGYRTSGVLRWALAALPEATRSVIWLYHAEGYTHEEIADAMGRTISFSKSQLARGTKKLRALLEIGTEVATHG